MVEFAACLPVLMLLLLAGVDLSRLIILNQKMDRVASGMGDLVAQSQTLSSADMTNIYAATGYIATPFDFKDNGVVIVSSISLTGGVLRINWQSRGSGKLTTVSKIGVSGGIAKLPTGLTVSGSDTLIAAEVYFNFTSYFGLSVVPNKQLYHSAFFRPRLGSLNTLN
jgi:Flp pilus assembly protein TadG